jgi:hypothetical protein
LSDTLPEIKTHIPYLRVKSRKATGVGMYVHFAYTEEAKSINYINKLYTSTSGYLKMEGLKDGLINDINFTDGKLDFIELVTYDEPWDGVIREFFWDDKL